MEIFAKVNQYLQDIETANPTTAEEVEQFRIKYVGSKNILKPLFGEIRNVPNERKKEFGQLVNKVKQTAEQKFQSLKAAAERASEQADAASIDLTAPAYPNPIGARHPISIVMNKIIDIFSRIGFVVAEEREIENDWYNFTAMNTPED
ncbi:MAG: phenylalanine--tRNA ligase subunit alpha, partial [Saprospiraceae bacterium]